MHRLRAVGQGGGVKGQSVREVMVLGPRPMFEKLEELWARAKEQVPDKTAESFAEFMLALALTGASVMDQALAQEKRKTTLVQPATRMPVSQGQQETLRRIKEQALNG